MAGYLDIRVNLIKGGVAKYGVTNPIYEQNSGGDSLLA